MSFIKDYFQTIYRAVSSLLKGMKLTGYYFLHRKEIITQEYPENRDTLILAERFRGEVVMPHDARNEHRCTGCTACELACPNGTIKIITKFDVNAEGKKRKPCILLFTISNYVRCAICVLWPALQMLSRWRKPLNTVCSTGINLLRL